MEQCVAELSGASRPVGHRFRTSSGWWGPDRLLTVWGLRVAGGAFRDGLHRVNGGPVTTDDEWQACYYVETTKGFDLARPVLRHVYVLFEPVETFRIARPWETENEALRRLGWQTVAIRPASRIPAELLDAFVKTLLSRTRREPFHPIRALDDDAPVPEKPGTEILQKKFSQMVKPFAHAVRLL